MSALGRAVGLTEQTVRKTKAEGAKAFLKLKTVRQATKDAIRKARIIKGATATKKINNARRRLTLAKTEHRAATARYKEAGMLLREQKLLASAAEQKERAKQKAIAEFVRKWEREYDRKLAIATKNVSLRKKWIRE
ncbi:MAG: hypothetical protein ACE5NW_16530 [Acidiferrobacterales bacterium]